ncbi:MAG: L,D-transpeptidase family protein, partial [Alphaproteobacteria bacterium]
VALGAAAKAAIARPGAAAARSAAAAAALWRTLSTFTSKASARNAREDATERGPRGCWRRRPRDLPATRVEVNIAAARLAFLIDGRPALAMKTIVGRPQNRTPMLSDHMEAVIFNPPWNVPASIAIKEIRPKARRDPGYLAREGFVTRENGELQQLPGPKNALGVVNFDLPNPFSVYLQDTPARSLFSRDQRWLSHGCVRLELPRVLARMVLADQGWDEAAVDAAVEARVTQRLALTRPIPVFLWYWTVFPEDGGISFRDDVYGWDKLMGAPQAGAPR